MEAFRQAKHILPSNKCLVNGIAYITFDTLEQLDFQIRFLSSLVFRLARESGIAGAGGIRILGSLNEVGEYMYKNEGDMVMLASPEHMPVVFKRRDLGWVKDSHEFANWLMANWTPESLVIAVS